MPPKPNPRLADLMAMLQNVAQCYTSDPPYFFAPLLTLVVSNCYDRYSFPLWRKAHLPNS